MLLTSTNLSREGYQGRIGVSAGHVTLKAVTGADEGSYTVRDADGQIKIKLCLNVKGERRQGSSLGPFHAWPGLAGQEHLCQDVVAVSLSGSALLVLHNGLLKAQMLMGLSRIKPFRCSGTVKELVMDALPSMCCRAPELYETAKWGKTEDRSDTQQLPDPPVLQPGPRPHAPSAAGQGSTDKCKWSLLIR